MPGKGGKGKGKTRANGPGGAGNSQRRSRSRNTTPASTSAFSETTHLSSELIPNLRANYEEILEKYTNGSTTDTSSIPTSGNLSSLKSDLLSLDANAKRRSKSCEKSLRELSSRVEDRKVKEKERQAQIEQEEKRRKAAEDEERKERDKVKAERDRKKKDKGERDSDSKRPPAVGAHQVTTQGPEAVVKGDKIKKRKAESPPDERPTKSSTSPSRIRSSEEHQPIPAAPLSVLETLENDPTVYEIPAVTDESTYEEKANAYSVTRFPEVDLTDLGPGDPPDADFSNPKPFNQVAMNTFNTFIEPYFRLFSEEDLGFLRERGDRSTPYIIPALGIPYAEAWAAEDNGFASPLASTNGPRNPNAPRGNPDNLTDDVLEKDDVLSCGPLLSRVIAAIIPEELNPDASVGDGDASSSSQAQANGESTPQVVTASTMPEPTQTGWKVPVGKSDYQTLEERIQREMTYIGLLGPNTEPDWKSREDDDVSARLRMLQAQLREQAALNGARKARIAEILKEQLAYQEYATILDDLDKQVEQAYSKRTRNMKATKKKKVVPNGVGVAQARVGIGEAARTLMERRKKWMNAIAPVFEEGLTRLPRGSIFGGLEELVEKEKEGVAEED
ncbi:histone acetyltransferases subunit 3-domain-containing protein [Tuber borchii]|uniref:Histone acetyltransferases subunit 3-domain-containing protein n=1 Tax=Tuber borchii TaxID=42251 RepID=A0A2T7A621_TUBBO|nr:histone acetyltransferases subunit 3-domain-containing protein [Tuber borchii]